MNVLVKLRKADNMKNIDKLRKIYNSLDFDLGVEVTSYGTLLIIIIIFDRIPTELKLLESLRIMFLIWTF